MNFTKRYGFLFAFACILSAFHCSNKITDNEHPVIAILSPADMSIVADSVDVTCTVSDKAGINWVELYVNGKPVSIDKKEPFEFRIYAAQYENGSQIKVRLLACDNNGNGEFSEPITLRIDHDKREQLLFSRNHGNYNYDLFISDINGENQQQLTHGIDVRFYANFSSDGKDIIFTDSKNIYVLENRANLRSWPVPDGCTAEDPVLNSATNLAYCSMCIEENDSLRSWYYNIFSLNITLGTFHKIDTPEPKEEPITFAVSPDGSRIACIPKYYGIHVMDRDGGNPIKINDSWCWGPIQFSSNSLRLVYSGGDPGNVYLANADGSSNVVLGASDTWHPAFSPDATRVVYANNHDHTIEIINADGTGLKALTTFSDEDIYFPQFTDDGLKIVFEQNQSIYIINTDGTGLKKLVDNASYPQLKPYARLLQ